eukprot:341211-Rhodomonas_salina.1
MSCTGAPLKAASSSSSDSESDSKSGSEFISCPQFIPRSRCTTQWLIATLSEVSPSRDVRSKGASPADPRHS